MDILMPMSGIDVLKAIKSSSQITKPFDNKDLVNRVKKLLTE